MENGELWNVFKIIAAGDTSIIHFESNTAENGQRRNCGRTFRLIDTATNEQKWNCGRTAKELLFNAIRCIIPPYKISTNHKEM